MKLSTAIRSYQAAARRNARESERQHKAAIRQHKQLLKEQMIAEAEEAVEEYNNYIDILNSVHKHCSEEIQWQNVVNETEPTKPTPHFKWSKSAEKELKSYTPNFIERLFGLSSKKIKFLQEKLLQAKEKDKQINIKKLNDFKEDYASWQESSSLANNIINKDVKSYKEAIELFNPFEELNAIGSTISIDFHKDYVKATLKVNDEEVIPKYTLKQNANGKLSKKELPKSKFNEFYQDYVCSCAIRVCREINSILPIKYIVLNATGQLLNTATGFLEERIILSIVSPAETISKINFEYIDPSDSMENFVHNMKFSKLKGFSPVEEISYQSIIEN